jgi:hypothetical protein
MRYRLIVLSLFAILPLMNVLAAPAPPISGILDIAPPPKGWSAEKHREMAISNLIDGMSGYVWADPEVRKLKSVADRKDDYPWLMKNIRVAPDGENRLRLTFRAGTDAEQATILNSLLCTYLRLSAEKRQRLEKSLRDSDEGTPRLLKLIKDERDDNRRKRYQEEWERSKVREADFRSEIARLKQIAVIRWAK